MCIGHVIFNVILFIVHSSGFAQLSASYVVENDDGKRVRYKGEDEATVVVFVSIGASLLGVDNRRSVLGPLRSRSSVPSSGHLCLVPAGSDFVCCVSGAVRDGSHRLEALVHRPEHHHFLLRLSLLPGGRGPLLRRYDPGRRGDFR